MGPLANHAERAERADGADPVDRAERPAGDADAGADGDADDGFAVTVASLPPELAVEEPLDIVTDGSEASLPADVSAQPTLSTIGRYALKQRLGEGGLGFVYEAWDPLLSRTVAVKTLQFDIDAPTRLALDRLFLNEARAAAGLNHPHIVTVYDAGLSAHGVYIAMERLRGRDLRQALAAGWRPTPAQAGQLVRRVADALAYAHARGVVHCDIKPANIFLTRKDRPTLLDFGIARVAHGAAVPGLEGLVAGSPHYLSPEQLQGGTIDGRTDVYSLAVVLYELLTGRKAFDGTSVEQITHAVLHAHPAPAHDLQPAVPQGLSDVVAQAMARDPAQRPAGAAELAQALRPWQDAAALAADAHSAEPAPPVPRWRQPAVLGPLALAAAAVIGWAALRDGPAADAPAAQASVPAPAAELAPSSAISGTTAVNAGDSAAIDVDTAPSTAAGTPPAGLPGGTPVARSATPAAPTANTPPTATRRAAAPRTPPHSPAKSATTPSAPRVAGVVQLAVSPWGEIEVDGRSAGVTPPLTRLSLPVGTHAITVRNGDYPAHTIEVQVTADQPVTLRHRFGS